MNKKCRPSEVAGSFYDDDQKLLLNSLQNCFDSVDSSIIQNALKQIKTLESAISPHAGYIYSGNVSAYSYALLQQYIQNKKKQLSQNKKYKILILAPIHTFYQTGLCQVNCDCYITPLGSVDSILIEDKNITKIDFDYSEHSIEVQLPFLQYIFDKLNLKFSIIPMHVGEIDANNIQKYIKLIKSIDYDFIIVSSDLSHFLDSESAKTKDNKTIKAVMDNNDFDYSSIDACGIYPIILLKELSRINKWNSILLNYANSGDIKNGDKKRVVGYGSIIFYK